MLYQVKLQYGFLVEGGSRDEAFQKALRRMRESPESLVSGVYPPSEQKGKSGILKMLWTGK